MPFKIRATCPICGSNEWKNSEEKEPCFICVACHNSVAIEEMELRCEETGGKEPRKKRYAIQIEWDKTDESEGEHPELPARIEIPEDITSEDDISDYISEQTGFCHKGFAVVEEYETTTLTESETAVGNDGSIVAVWAEDDSYFITAVLIECISPDEAAFIKKTISRKTRDKLLNDETGEVIWQYLAEDCRATARGPYEDMASLYNAEIKKRRELADGL